MSEQQTPAEGTSAPVEPQPAATPQPTVVVTQSATPAASAVAAPPPQPAPAPVEKPRVKASDLPDDALKLRLEQAERKATEAVYASLGKSPEEIKALVDAEQARAEAQKTLEQKNAEQATQLEQAARYREAVVAQIEAALPALSDDQRAVLDIITDPADKLRAIARMKPASAQASQQAATPQPAEQPPAQAPAAPATAPVSTAPAPTAPGAGTPAGEVDHRTKFEELHKQNPFAAAHYGLAHQASVFTPKAT